MREIWPKMNIGLHVKYPLFLWDFIRNSNFPDTFSKNIQILNFIKIRPVGPEMFHAGGWTDRRTDMTKLIVAFAILRRLLTTEGNLYYWIFLFSILWNKYHNIRTLMVYIPLITWTMLLIRAVQYLFSKSTLHNFGYD